MQTPPCEQVRAGEIARDALKLGHELCASLVDGKRLDKEIEEFIRDQGGEPALKGYHPSFALKPYEWTTCLSVDNGVVHGVPIKLLGPRSIITIDLVVRYQGWHADTARTFTHSDDPIKKQFVEASSMIFEMAKDAIWPEQSIGLFGTMIERGAQMQNYGVVKEYCGHGIGKAIHIDPQVLNYHTSTAEVFQVGRSYAVEPVLAIKPTYTLHHDTSDGFTVTANCLVTHNEDTIFIGAGGIINLTGEQS
ncbi:MAG: M24 family metallopeptidase [Candidatus Thorarchaeota archaeon]|jgi:methionyl aminopeptidase